MMGKYCGDSIPPSHISSSNEILIHFETDGSETRNGFKIEYSLNSKLFKINDIFMKHIWLTYEATMDNTYLYSFRMYVQRISWK